MNQLDSIWTRARSDLLITTEPGDDDVFLWEHSARVAQSAQEITRLPLIQSHSVDTGVVVAAALYHDAGWIAHLSSGIISRYEMLVRPPPDTHREQGTLLMERSLKGILAPEAVKHVSLIIRTLNERTVESIEGKIVAEAENLDEFGLQALWPNIRRGALDGKGVQALIDTWHRRKEYQFWSARLNDSFRFAPIRELAKRRLATYERVMKEIEALHRGVDIEAAVGGPPADQPESAKREWTP